MVFGSVLWSRCLKLCCNIIVIRWENWLEVLRFIANVAVSKSRHRLFFYPKGKVKMHRKDLWDVFLSSGGRLWKGKVLAPFSSMVIHGLLVTCFRSLAFAFQLFEMVLCVCGFENVLKKMPCLGNLCNNSFECFTKVFVFLKRCFNVFWKFVLKLCWDVCLKNGKDVLQVWSSN